MKRTIISCLLGVVLVTGLLVGCVDEEPTPPVTPEPTPPVTPEPPTPPPLPHEQVSLTLRCGMAQYEGYKQGFGIGDLLNKEHPWLRATVRTSAGAMEDYKILMANPEELLPSTVVWTSAAQVWAQREGIEQYWEGEPYLGARLLWTGFLSVGCLVTLDPDINTLADLWGKKVATYPRGAVFLSRWESLFRGQDALTPGFYDSLDIQYLGFVPAHAALRDGLIDAAYASFTIPVPGTEPPENWFIPGWAQETMMKPEAHLIDFPKAAQDAGNLVEDQYFNIWLPVPAGGIRADLPAHAGFSFTLAACADVTMPDEVTYELTKFVFEHMDALEAYSIACKSWQPENRCAYWLEDENELHAGAIKFYKEVGVPLK